jgi:hypothetical protein
MAKDIEQELDAIFAHHKARVEQARNEAAGKPAAEVSEMPLTVLAVAG